MVGEAGFSALRGERVNSDEKYVHWLCDSLQGKQYIWNANSAASGIAVNVRMF